MTFSLAPPCSRPFRAPIAAVMLDLGFPAATVKAVPILARTASLLAHLAEEQQIPIGFLTASGNPTIGVLQALAKDLEVHVGPRSVLPSKTRWSPASAALAERDDPSGPFA